MPKAPPRNSEQLYISAEDADVIDLFIIRRSFNPDGSLRYVQVIGDAEELEQFVNNQPVIVQEGIVTNQRAFALPRLIMQRMLGRPLLPEERVKTINGKNGDCRRHNLELTTRSELAKVERTGWSQTGEKYVYPATGTGRFYANVAGIYIGTYDTASQASEAVKLYLEFLEKGMPSAEAARRVKGRSRNKSRFNVE